MNLPANYAALPAAAQRPLIDAFLSGRKQSTIDAYGRDLEQFRRFVGADTVSAAADMLMAAGHGGANSIALAWRTSMVEAGLSPATINRRLASVRSLVALARTLGFVTWTIDIAGLKSRSYRDTRGPGRDAYRDLLRAASGQRNAHKAARDVLALRLLHDMGLRRGEVLALDMVDVDLPGRRLMILGKGRTEKEALTIPPQAAEALARWLGYRGIQPGPLFVSLHRAGNQDERLSAMGLHRLVADAGRAAGVRVWPHALRHTAITTALDLSGGDVRKVQRFSRHADPRTLMIYDDSRVDHAGELAALIEAAAAI